MIKQNFRMELGATVCDFGNGDISVGVQPCVEDLKKGFHCTWRTGGETGNWKYCKE